PLARFSPRGIATRWSAKSSAFAYATRCSGVHAHAPDRHALASGTVWSMSRARADVFSAPDQGSIQSPAATVQSPVVVKLTGACDSATRTSARVSWQWRSASTHALPKKDRSYVSSCDATVTTSATTPPGSAVGAADVGGAVDGTAPGSTVGAADVAGGA